MSSSSTQGLLDLLLSVSKCVPAECMGLFTRAVILLSRDADLSLATSMARREVAAGCGVWKLPLLEELTLGLRASRERGGGGNLGGAL